MTVSSYDVLEHIIKKQDNNALNESYAVFFELRPHLEKQKSFIEQVRRQHENDGYDVTVVKNNNEVLSAIGFRVSEHLAWGKILYVDDLVTRKNARHQGLAERLLDWSITYARSECCDAIHLDSGYGRKSAHRLYLSKGFHLTSHHFSLIL